MDEATEHKEVPARVNDTLNVIWADVFNIGVRADNLCLLRFFSSLPEAAVEQARIITSRDHLKAFVDGACASLDYYPEKKKVKKKKTAP